MFKSLKQKLSGWVSRVKKEGKKQELEEKKLEKKTAKLSELSKKGKKKKEREKKENLENKKKKLDLGKGKKEKKEKKEGGDEEKSIEDEEKVEEEENTGGFFSRTFSRKLDDEKFEEIFKELEMILLQNNVALDVVDKIKMSLKEKLIGSALAKVDLEKELKSVLEDVLVNPPNFISEIKRSLGVKKPFVIAFVGINGSGKTTSIAKIAHLLKKEKLLCCLAAADTFRAASIEQLEKHAEKLKIPVIKKDYGSDPASVGFDAVDYAKKHHIDVVLIDTAGRLNTSGSLMKEVEKIVRVSKADMRIFVGESITGNDATEQAKVFNDSVDLSGIILSKADVDEKGGTALSVSHITKKPVFFLGTGQEYGDLEVFDKSKLLKSLGL